MGRRRLKKQGFTSGQAGLARREQMTRLRIGIKVPTQLHSKPHAADCATIHARVVAVKEMQRQGRQAVVAEFELVWYPDFFYF
jgi:hypothetical protein